MNTMLDSLFNLWIPATFLMVVWSLSQCHEREMNYSMTQIELCASSCPGGYSLVQQACLCLADEAKWQNAEEVQ